MLVVPDIGETTMLQTILGQPLYLRLYANNHWPDEADTTMAYEEAVFPGYMAEMLLPTSWDYRTGIEAVHIDIEFRAQKFAGQFIYGYYVTTMADVLLWAERFVGEGVPYPMVNNDDRIIVSPRFAFVD